MATENGVMEDKKARKSVSFLDTAEAVNGNGSVVEATNNFDGAKSASEDQPAAESTGDKAVDEITDMFKGLTKKKKTKKPKEGEKKEDDAAAAADDAGAAADGEFDASALKKKKKKKTTTTSSTKAAADTGDSFEAKLAEAGVGKEGDQRDGGDAAAAVDGQQQEGAGAKGAQEQEEESDVVKGTGIWAHDATQPISYALLLSRFYMLLHSHHPDLASSGTKSYKIPPPQCLREGNKKTIFANISEICKRMRRSDEHVTQFIFAELGTSGSVDGSRRLVIRGRFQQKQLENVLRRYIMEYVTCKTCRSPDTELNKGENRLYFVTCNSCGSRRSVTAIKTGFTAQIGKRRRQQG